MTSRRSRQQGKRLKIIIAILVLILAAVLIVKCVGPQGEPGSTGGDPQSGGTVVTEPEENGEGEEPGTEEPSEPAVVEEPMPASELSGGYLILVNKTHPVEKGEPDDLVMAPYYADRSGTYNRYIRSEACTAYGKLVEAAKEAGYDIRLTSAFRTYDVQKSYYDQYVAQKGQEWADKYSAKPGTSEHQTGLAIDVSAPSVNWELTDEFAGTEEGQWLKDHCCEFGFIIRYPKDKEDVTGYSYEPWHIRYVGMEAAKVIYKKGLCLEEYLEQYGE